MSLRDIGFILKKGQVNHGVVTIMDNGSNSSNNNNKPASEKATQAYKLFSQGKNMGIRETMTDIRRYYGNKSYNLVRSI